jgi:8-oxo-dGTP diphosphatase
MAKQKNHVVKKELAEGFYQNLLDSARTEGITRFSVGAVISEGKKVLLFRREKNDFLGGIYEVPGGTLEKGESIKGCLKREVMEETGILVDLITQHVGNFDYSSENKSKTRQFNFAVEVKFPLTIKLSSEHDDFTWVTPEDVDKINPTESIRTILNTFWKG